MNGVEQGVEVVLGLAEMELTFSLAALVLLCFAFVAKTVLMLHHFFGCCGTVFAFSHGFLLLSPSQTTGRVQSGDS